MKNCFLVLGLMMTLVAVGAKQPYNRYQSVVDRQMFGPLPVNFDPTKMPSEVAKSERGKELTKEQEKLQSAIRFSVINVTPDGETRVGFTDNSDVKVPMHYYLKVGEERDGWKVLSADAETATMTVSKGDIEVSLTIGGNSAQGGGTTSRSGGASAQASPRPSGPRTSSLLGGGSLRSRRKLRDEQHAQEKAEFEERIKRIETEREEQRLKDEAEREEQRKQLQTLQETLLARRKEQQEKEKEEKPAEESEDGNNETE